VKEPQNFLTKVQPQIMAVVFFYGVNRLSRFPWNEVEGHFSHGDEPPVTLAQLYSELARVHPR